MIIGHTTNIKAKLHHLSKSLINKPLNIWLKFTVLMKLSKSRLFIRLSRTRTRRRAAAGTVNRATSRGQSQQHHTAVWKGQSPTEAVSNNHNHHNHSNSSNNNCYYYRGRRHRHLVYSGGGRNQRRLATASTRRQDACWCFKTGDAMTTQHCQWPSLKLRRYDCMDVLSQYQNGLIRPGTDLWRTEDQKIQS